MILTEIDKVGQFLVNTSTGIYELKELVSWSEYEQVIKILDSLNVKENSHSNHVLHPAPAAPTEQAAPLFERAPTEKPKYIQTLIETGRIDSEMTVLTSLEDVAICIRSSGINLKTNHLKQFKNSKTNKEYSPSAIRQAITAAYTQ